MNKKTMSILVIVSIIASVVLITAMNTTDSMAQIDPNARRRAALARARQLLASKSWVVYLTVQEAKGRKKAVVETDVLTFTERSVSSEYLSAQGYAIGGSNYSPRIGDDGAVIWETMQVNENGKDIVSVMGKLQNGIMKGQIFYRFKKGTKKTCGFTSIAPM